MAKKKGTPYEVNEMSTNDFINIKSLCDNIGENFTTDEDGKKVVWNDIKELKIEKEKPKIIKFRTSFLEENYRKINLQKKTRGKPSTSINLENAYTQPPKISSQKKAGLLQLCQANLIKPQ